MAYYRFTSPDDTAAEPGRRAVPLRGGGAYVVALVAMVAALAFVAGVDHASGVTNLNTSYTVEIDR